MPWEPRIWTGMDAASWFRLLARHRFAVNPTRLPMVLIQTGISAAVSLLNGVEALFYHRRIAAAETDPDPLFILGHWRTGTTLLQELMALDPRHASPTTYECFGASHFLLTERFVKWWLNFLLPRRRPMDNVAVGLDQPQEDEFALIGLGAPSPYLDWAFANRAPQYEASLDLRSLPPAERKRWKEALLWFLKSLTVKHPGKRIVLKSPTHTCRVRTLLELFPRARFVHIARDPFVVIPSTLHMWKRMTKYHGAQAPKHDGLEHQVLDRFQRMSDAFAEDRRLIAPGRLCEMRYEDLVADPVAQVREIYEQLDLGDIAPALPALEQHVASMRDYCTNRYAPSAELQEAIAIACAPYIEQYGYRAPGERPSDLPFDIDLPRPFPAEPESSLQESEEVVRA